MTSSGNAPTEGAHPTPEDTTALTILADVASQPAPEPKKLNQQSTVPYINPITGEEVEALLISKDDPRLTPEFLQQFRLVLAVDDDAKPIKDSEEAVAAWTDDLRRKQAYRGRGYATEIVEISADKAVKEKEEEEEEEREKAGSEEKEAKKKVEMEELERRKKMKKEAEKEEGRKRKQARKEAAERRKNFPAYIKPEHDPDMDATQAADEE
jgi:hypothetical protein